MSEFRTIRKPNPKDLLKKPQKTKSKELLDIVKMHKEIFNNLPALKYETGILSNEEKILLIKRVKYFLDILISNPKKTISKNNYFIALTTICLAETRLDLKIDARDSLRRLIDFSKKNTLNIESKLEIISLAIKLGFGNETQEMLLKLINDYDSRIISDITGFYIRDLNKETEKNELRFLDILYKFIDTLPEDENLSISISKTYIANHYTLLGQLDKAKEIISKQKGFAKKLFDEGKYDKAMSIYLNLIWNFCINLLNIKDNRIKLNTRIELLKMLKEYTKFGNIIYQEAEENDSKTLRYKIGKLYEAEEWLKEYIKSEKEYLESN